jgi:hypothetical protein
MAVALLLSLVFSGVQVAQGYLLPPQQVMEFVARQTSRVYNFRLEAVAEIPDPNLAETRLRTEVTYYAARPDFLRQETVEEYGSNTVLVGSGRRLSLLDGYLLEEKPRHEEIFPTLLLANSMTVLERLLVEEEVDINQVHLARMGNQVAYVIGGPPKELEAPQFWCDKDHFRPLRLVGRRSQQGVADQVDIRFLSYRKVAEHIWMPGIIEFYRQGELFLRLVINKTHPNERLPESLFDFRAFATEHPPLPPAKETTGQTTEELEQMRRYLEKKYE